MLYGHQCGWKETWHGGLIKDILDKIICRYLCQIIMHTIFCLKVGLRCAYLWMYTVCQNTKQDLPGPLNCSPLVQNTGFVLQHPDRNLLLYPLWVINNSDSKLVSVINLARNDDLTLVLTHISASWVIYDCRHNVSRPYPRPIKHVNIDYL